MVIRSSPWRSTEPRKHPRKPYEIQPAIAAANWICDSAQAENFEQRAAFQQAAHRDGEEAATVGGRRSASALGYIEHDAEGSPFELVTQVGVPALG